MTATTDQWNTQFYPQPLMDNMPLTPSIEGFSDATVVTTSPTMVSDCMTLSSSNSYTTKGHLTPKGNNNAFKPIRRRSRASKRTPTTLLNANTTNFRALVQKFTGCPTTNNMSFPSVHKGPLTLNFQQGRSQQQIHHHNTSNRTVPPLFVTRSYNQVHQVAEPLVPWQKQQPEQLEWQSGNYSLEHERSSNFLPTSDGLLMDNDFSLHELTVNADFSNYIIKNDGYFV